jgi:hypothetical protein
MPRAVGFHTSVFGYVRRATVLAGYAGGSRTGERYQPGSGYYSGSDGDASVHVKPLQVPR